MRSVHIKMPGETGNPADINVDGERVRGVRAFTLSSPRVGAPTVLTLELVVLPTEYFGVAGVFISTAARETLIRFGWTPPPVDLVKRNA